MSNLPRLLFSVLALLLLWGDGAEAKFAPASLLKMAGDSDTGVVGEIVEIKGDAAVVKVNETVFGRPVSGTISVAPISEQTCTGAYISVKKGDEMLFLLSGTEEPGAWKVVGGGSGKLPAFPESKAPNVEALKKLFELARIRQPRELHRAMLTLVHSSNPILHSQASSYVVSVIGYAEDRQEYAQDFLALLSSEQKAVRLTGLNALRFVHVEKEIPRLAEATRDPERPVAVAASMALAQYDTAESAAALIALVRHADPERRIRGAIDLERSRRPEAKAALVALLDDRDAAVRQYAPQRLIPLLRADDFTVLPKLIAMLHDPDVKVQTAAASTLGESRKGVIVPPLIEVLKRPQLDPELELRTLQSLYMAASDRDGEAQPLLAQNLPLFVASLQRNGNWVATMQCVGIFEQLKSPEAIAALTQAAESHGNKETRDQAAQALGRLKAQR